MADLSALEIEAANQRGRVFRDTQPYASAARYDARADRIIVDLTNGATFAFPPRLVKGLADANAAQLADIEIIGGGLGLHWEALDVDFTVPGLVNGIFGTAKWMAANAGGTVSAAKSAAARANGTKGGRPRKAG